MVVSSRKKFSHGGNLRQLANSADCSEDALLDFSASINPLGPPEYLRAVMSSNISSLLHYPDPDCTHFAEIIASELSVKSDQIIVGNGSTEIIYALPHALKVRRGILPAPSYIGYEEAFHAVGITLEYLILQPENQFEIHWDSLGAMLQEGDMVFLGQPNNPTGGVLDFDQLQITAKEYPDTYFVVDEAFIDFIDTSESSVGLTSVHPNIIVLRSMTKFYAIPGLRLGFAVAHCNTASKIRSVIPPWSVNSLAIKLGEKLITDHAYAARTRELLVNLRKHLKSQLEAVTGLTVLSGEANYLFIELSPSFPYSASELARELLKRGIAIRACDNFAGLNDRYIRLAIRPEKENEKLVQALAEILGISSKQDRVAKTPSLMFQGNCSDAGKSILTAALCRILFQDGVKVAPFKSQNMSLNSFVTHDGREMGRAQVVQAQACRLDPDVRMNPVLLKPSSDVGSQVIVNGKPVGNMSVSEYVNYKPKAFLSAQRAYDSLASENEVVILEGAGSPGEVNLKSHDIVNMRMAEYAGSPVLLVGDIDRGGVYASFVGTMEVLSEWERNLVAGFIVNRFRGQESLLADAHSYTAMHTGKPVLGVVPHIMNLGLPEEDSVSFKKGLFEGEKPEHDCVEVALVDLPHISNFTDFEALLAEPDIFFNVVKSPDQLGSPDVIILPGSKNVISDLNYLITSGMAECIKRLADSNSVEVVGVCGGFQMLGQDISDPYEIESSGAVSGMGLLPISTVLEKEKTLTRRSLTHKESGCSVYGYEIHHGQTSSSAETVFEQSSEADLGVCSGRIWGCYLHGIFDADEFRTWFIERLRARKGLEPYSGVRSIYDLEPAFERLAQTVRSSLDMDCIYKLLGL